MYGYKPAINGFTHRKGEFDMRIYRVLLLILSGLLLLGSVVRVARGATQAATITFTCCSYSPATVTIQTGEDVTWRGGFLSHPLVSQDGLWPTVGSGAEFSHTFTQPGEYWFYCDFHGGPNGQGMSGKVIVVDTQRLFLPLINR